MTLLDRIRQWLGFATEQPTMDLSVGEICHLTKNSRRRAVVRNIVEHDRPVNLGELAETIAARENDTDPASLTAGQSKRVYIGLYQSHLPKLDDHGVVEFDRNRGIITAADNTAACYAFLNAVEEFQADDVDVDAAEAFGRPTTPTDALENAASIDDAAATDGGEQA